MKAFNLLARFLDLEIWEHVTRWLAYDFGVLRTAAIAYMGIGLGYLLLKSLFKTQFAEQFPDIQFQVIVSSTTVLVAALIGVLVVAVTPLFTVRRIIGMNIPDMLRVVE